MITEEIIRELLPYVKEEQRVNFANKFDEMFRRRPVEIPKPTLDEVLNIVSKHTGVSVKDIEGLCRKAEYSSARHLYCFIAKGCYPAMTWRQIGLRIKKDHATVIHSVKKIGADIFVGEEITDVVNGIAQEMNSPYLNVAIENYKKYDS